MLDSTRLRAELYFIHRTLSRAVVERCANLLDDLRSEVEGTTSELIWRSLYADCLRVAYGATTLDGVINDAVLSGIRGLLLMASQHYDTPQWPHGLRAPLDLTTARSFLTHYAFDSEAFGRGSTVRWRGFGLCKRAAEAGEPEPLLRYARLIRWVIDTLTEAACQLSGVSAADPRWQKRLSEIAELREVLVRAGYGPERIPDSRKQVFLNKTRVFDPIQLAASVSEPDPFDVEELHADARTSFRTLVDQAISSRDGSNAVRTLLITSGSGAGKTHLLRSFRSYVQDYGRGFAVYAPIVSHSDDYPRYLLHCLVTSLGQSYSGEHTGLHELASGLGRLSGGVLAEKVQKLSGLVGEPREKIDAAVNELVGTLLRHPELNTLEPDLLRVLLYSLCPDAALVPRINQYMRCGDLNDADRRALGNVVPLVGSEAPRAMLRSLAKLMFLTRRATMVLMVDQAELSGVDSDRALLTFQRTVDSLLGIASDVRSVVVVVACLSNLYEKAVRVLGRPTLDRLEKDPPPVQLRDNRSFDEIKAIVGVRLAWLFAEAGAEYQPNEPTYPIPEALLRGLANRQPREVLDQCQLYRDRCIAAGKILPFEDPPLPAVPPHKPSTTPLDQLASEWNATRSAADLKTFLSDGELLNVIAEAARAYGKEVGAATTATIKKDVLKVLISAGQRTSKLAIAITNGSPPGGVFGNQMESVRKAGHDAIAVALRTSAFPRGAKSVEAVDELTEAGGRAIVIDKPAMRILLANHQFATTAAPEHVEAWRRRDRPISNDPTLASIFEHAPSGTEDPANARVVVEVPDIAVPPLAARKRAGSRPRAAP
jgi:hypothetical protein